MNHTNKKAKGGSNSPMTKLKQLWRAMPDDERERWRSVFVSNVPSAEIRERIRAELDIGLDDDAQLCRFRDWEEKERVKDELEELMKEDERYWEEQFGRDEALTRARNKLLRCSYARSIRYGNYQEGLRTLRGDCRIQRADLAVKNSAELHKDGQARALELCLDDAKKFPEVVDLFRHAFTALGKAREEQV
jgi:hypothetical protein